MLEEADATAPKAGILPTENRDVVDNREARDPGLKGEGRAVATGRGADAGKRVGDGGGGGEVVEGSSLTSAVERVSSGSGTTVAEV